MRILVIEDDAESRGFIARGLRELGHSVDVAANGRDGLFLATESGHDVMIVDRLLPALDGVALVRTARGSGVRTPVLFLTALDGVGDRVAGLDAGGDDYLVKPFAFAELVARVNALARRPPLAESETVLRVGDIELDRLKRTISRGGKPVILQQREYQLLEHLLLNADRIVTRTMLLETIWGFHFDPKTNIVETHMSRLRAKLAQGAACAEIIHTVRGAGYVLRTPAATPP